ncbi:MAG: 50S ribosomal protein L11 methyltransferase [Bacteroidota bacterium]|nr:50S ribosomal protein L11 methyltransferase [Bacteroidota bacterium]
MKTYLEISISASKPQQELLLPTMVELGCHGFGETDTELLCYIDKSLWSEEKFELLKTEIKNLIRTLSSNSDIKIKEIQEENWNDVWEKSIQPIEVGNKITIKPSWANYENTSGRIVIQIDPKMSFGTGYHETTRLTLRLLEKYIKKNDVVLDVGTGTGILAIAAIKLGGSRALGIDNDEWSIDNAKENVAANNLADKIEISDSALASLPETKYDLITANIMFNTILEMLPDIVKRIKSERVILFSGLLLIDDKPFLSGIEKFNLKIIEKLTEGEWLAFALQKS